MNSREIIKKKYNEKGEIYLEQTSEGLHIAVCFKNNSHCLTIYDMNAIDLFPIGFLDATYCDNQSDNASREFNRTYDNVLYLADFQINNSYRGKGIASLVFDRFLKQAKEDGIIRIDGHLFKNEWQTERLYHLYVEKYKADIIREFNDYLLIQWRFLHI